MSAPATFNPKTSNNLVCVREPVDILGNIVTVTKLPNRLIIAIRAKYQGESAIVHSTFIYKEKSDTSDYLNQAHINMCILAIFEQRVLTMMLKGETQVTASEPNLAKRAQYIKNFMPKKLITIKEVKGFCCGSNSDLLRVYIGKKKLLDQHGRPVEFTRERDLELAKELALEEGLLEDTNKQIIKNPKSNDKVEWRKHLLQTNAKKVSDYFGTTLKALREKAAQERGKDYAQSLLQAYESFRFDSELYQQTRTDPQLWQAIAKQIENACLEGAHLRRSYEYEDFIEFVKGYCGDYDADFIANYSSKSSQECQEFFDRATIRCAQHFQTNFPYLLDELIIQKHVVAKAANYQQAQQNSEENRSGRLIPYAIRPNASDS